jgi:glutamine synthetase
MTLEQAQSFLAENDVRYVLAQFVDIHGVAKTKAVPVGHFEDIVTEGAGFAGFAVWGLGQEPHDPDFMAVGDPSTLTLVPWQDGFARIVCEGRVGGEPWPLDTRHILGQQLKRLEERDWTFQTGLEPEFMLLRRTEEGLLGPADATDRLEKPCYDYKGLSRSLAFIDELVTSLISIGFDVYQIDHEDSNGQFEINFTYTDAMTSADRLVLFRMAAGEIARSLGMVCSFMPKPTETRTGSGMHIHMSITDSVGKSLFNDDSDERQLGLSELAYHFLGGLLEHAPALAALTAPTVNSYKRLVVGGTSSGATWAPAYISYGDNNRTSMVRVPYGRLELRLPDSSCNPYLATAAVLAAGMDGVDRQLDPGQPSNFNHYRLSEEETRRVGIGILPQNLGAALMALDDDPLFREQLGAEFIDEFLSVKTMEWVDYQRHVSEWEVDRYLEFF